jgi:uncharacterized membrane protein
MTWEAYVSLAFDEIRLAGAGSPQVSRRLVEALDDLESVAPPQRRHVLREQRAMLSANVGNAVSDERDVSFALVADRHGIGVRATD